MKLFAAASLAVLAAAAGLGAAKAPAPVYDVVIRGGEILDGSGGRPAQGDVAVKGERIVFVGPHAPGRGKTEIDAKGKAVSPGFIESLARNPVLPGGEVSDCGRRPLLRG
ncbi:hypothetical protein [Phenylobacterium sp.]|jgi:N-acyl-D-amino-acid deacylase|uniref:hypothetical protein n=1 Tax=Phenylobacterium sp. TaxID=1871053 RepID=UPI002F3FCD4F